MLGGPSNVDLGPLALLCSQGVLGIQMHHGRIWSSLRDLLLLRGHDRTECLPIGVGCSDGIDVLLTRLLLYSS